MKKENILTIDIGASKIRLQAIDSKGESGFQNTANLVGLEINNASFLEFMTELIRAFMDSNKDVVFKAISIGSPGPLNSSKGIIENPPNLKGINNLPIVEELKRVFELPVFLLNDADAALLGEWWLGAGKEFKDIIYITLSTGVGSGILKNGELQNKLELGHRLLTIDEDERTCNCNELNHAEAYLGTNGLSQTYAKIFEINFDDLKPEDIYKVSFEMRDGIRNSDPKWLKVEKQYSEHLSEFLKDILDKYQPEIIILGGGIIYENNHLLGIIHEILKDSRVKIVLAKLKNPVNLGVAKYALKQLRS